METVYPSSGDAAWAGALITKPSDYLPFDLRQADRSFASLFEEQVRRVPDQIAIRDGGSCVTYGDLNEAANRLAHRVLQQWGNGQPIALLMPPSAACMVALLAILKTGNICVGIEPTLPPARIRLLLESKCPRLLLADDAFRGPARECARGICAVLNAQAQVSGPDDNPNCVVSSVRPAMIFFTSGSTGTPKGVMFSEQALLHMVWRAINSLGIARSDRVGWLRNPSMLGIASDALAPLLAGATLIPIHISGGEAGPMIRSLDSGDITIAGMGAAHFRLILDALAGTERFSALRSLTISGQGMFRSDVERFRAHFPRTCSLSTGYGTTETGFICGMAHDHTSPLSGETLPVGYPLPGITVRLLDDDGREVPDGAIGEITVESPSIADGYWQEPNLTRTVFKTRGGTRSYLTGDLGRRRPDGCIEHLGRKDHQIKIRGFRIEPGEVETALVRVAGVKDAVVSAQPDAHGDNRLVAYIVPSQTPPPGVSDLRRALAATLPDHMLPAVYVFLDALPLAASGKVARRLLPAPERSRPLLKVAFAAPSLPSEVALAAIWCNVLGLAEVGLDDPFLDLGGNSLQAARIIARVLAEFRVDLPVAVLFEQSTIRAMATLVASQRAQHLQHERLEGLLHALEALPESEAQEFLVTRR